MTVLFFLILVVPVAAFVSYPFWGKGGIQQAADPAVAALEAARDSKYREIRDAETDLASGKLSAEDFDLVNTELRVDAVEILKQLDQAGGPVEGGDEPPEDDQVPPKPADS